MCLQSASFLVDRPSTSFMWQKSSSTFVLGLHNVGNHPWGFQVHPYGHSHITLIFQNLILVHLTIARACWLTARRALFKEIFDKIPPFYVHIIITACQHLRCLEVCRRCSANSTVISSSPIALAFATRLSRLALASK